MLKIHQDFMFLVIVALVMFLLLGLSPETDLQNPEDRNNDVLSVGYSGRGKIINGYRIVQKLIRTDFYSFGNNSRNNTMKTNTVSTLEKSRPENCTSCFQLPFSYIYKNDKLCLNTTTKVKLLILILTTHGDVKRRETLRKTWLSISNQNVGNLRYVFLLGRHTRSNDWNKKALAEAKKHGDILIIDYMDEYKNLTLKTMTGLKWANEFCPSAEYVMKTDSDMWVNTPRLLHFIDSFKIGKEIIGSCFSKASPVRLKSKWYVSLRQYPQKFYPKFCSGTGYLTTMKVVGDIVKISPNIPFFPLEDVYIGLCMKALGYKHRTGKGFHKIKVKFDPCEYQKIITSHRLAPSEIEKVWNAKCWTYT